MGGKDDIFNMDFLNSKLGRILILVALLGGGIGNYRLSTVDVSDRYKASNARYDFAARDARLTAIEQRDNIQAKIILDLNSDIKRLSDSYQAHLEHSAKYTEVIRREERRSLENEQDLKRHLREDHYSGRNGSRTN